MTSAVFDLIEEYEQRLSRAGVLKPRDEARQIVKKILGDKAEIDISSKEAIDRAIGLREQRMPIDRIFGVSDFCGLRIKTEKDVFRPYPETEDLVEYALSCLEYERQDIRILDLGTGTGCILLALLAALPEATGLGIDINDKALEIAQKNAEENGLDERCEFRKGDWDKGIDEKFDMVISNPPRSPSSVLPHLPPEMRNFDPINALDGGEDGLDFIRRTAQCFGRLTNEKAYCLCQHGPAFAGDIEEIFNKAGFLDTKIMGDYIGQPACIIVKKGFGVPAVQIKLSDYPRMFVDRLKACF